MRSAEHGGSWVPHVGRVGTSSIDLGEEFGPKRGNRHVGGQAAEIRDSNP